MKKKKSENKTNEKQTRYRIDKKATEIAPTLACHLDDFASTHEQISHELRQTVEKAKRGFFQIAKYGMPEILRVG